MAESLSNCALIMGLPGNREAFCRKDPASDYAMTMFRTEPADAWKRVYAKCARMAADLVVVARRLGVKVYEDGDLSVLREATETCDVVIVFGHSRSTLLTQRDFRSVGGSDRTAAAIERLGRADIPFAPQLNCFADIAQKDLIEALNAAIKSGLPFLNLPVEHRPPTGGNKVVERMLSREMIDTALADLVISGGQVELFGRLYGVDQVVEALAPTFSGELALFVCHSTGVATAIEATFKLRIRLASWTIAVLPDGYYAVVSEALRRLAGVRTWWRFRAWAGVPGGYNGSFLDIMAQLEDMLSQLRQVEETGSQS